MPFETMGQRGLSASSCFHEEICFSSEKELGFWKPKTMHYFQDGKVQTPHSKLVISSPLEKLFSAGALSVDCLELSPSHVARDHKERHHIGGEEGTPNCSRALGEYINNNNMANPNLFMQAVSYSVETNKTNVNGTRYWNSLSSNKLSEVFGRKLGLSTNNILLNKSIDTVASCHEGEEPFGSMEENEAQTIKNLLPDEDDLFSGVIDGLEYIDDAKGGDDIEDFDLFSSVGGMELEVDDVSCAGQKDSDFTGGVPNGQGSSNGSITSTHPSRTLFLRNINGNVEDSELRVLFEQYGDIRTLYTACKRRGFVMISYFDIRAARNAMRALQNKLLGCQKLDIHYSIPKDNPLEQDINQGTVVVSNLDSSLSNDDLHKIFGIYGEIKEIHETPHKFHLKFIEFYDVRAAEAARCALNKCNIAGKRIKLGPSCPGSARLCLMQKGSELEQDEAGLSRSSSDILSSESMSTVSHGGRTVGCYDNGSVQGLHSASHVPLSALTENAVSHGSSCVLNSSPSPLRVASAGNHCGFHKPHHSLDQVKFGSKCIPSFHPNSFPDCQDNFNVSIPHNSSSTVVHMAGKIGSRVSDGMNGRHRSMVGSCGQPMEIKGGVSGLSGNVPCPVHGHHWSNSNSFQHHPSSPMVWQNSPLFSNGVNAPCPPQLTGLYGMSPDMLNTVSPPHHLHVGSAPSICPSLRDRQQAYTGESTDGSAFCLGSLGSVGFLGNSLLHPLGRASHIFSHAGGTCLEKSTNDVLHSPHQMSRICPSRNTVGSLSTSFGSLHECGRNLSYRRNQGNSSHADKKQFELDIDSILRGEDSRTTLMIKNIPNKYTSKMLLAAIDEHCRGTYDFIYLPIDFKNKCNVGYAFINLIDPLQIIPFYKAFSGEKWEKFNSEKVAALAYARIQGKAALVAHFQNSSLMNEDKRCRPILFCTDGPNAGEQEPFPMGTNFRLKAGRARINVNEENHHQGSPSMSVNGADSSNRSDDSSGSSRESD